MNKKPISLAEVKEVISEKLKGEKEGKPEKERLKAVNDLLKKVTKIKPSEAQKLKEELIKLNIIKLNEKDVIKIIDFMPEDAEDLRKIFFGQGTNLDENEINSVLNIVKKYK